MGALPPLSAADWQDAFDRYRQIAQYKLVNRGMSLDAFKFIFWWEWGHRFLGRLVGIVFAIPFALFWLRGWLPRPLVPKLVGLFALGGLQGFIGWYMVQSGLVDRTEVSQYRLALHLTVAALIFAACVWLILDLARPQALRARLDTVRASARPLAWALLALVFLQIGLGALVAGMKAGLAHNTWPLMDGRLVPSGLFAMSPWWVNLFENALTVQFDHRLLAYAIAALGLWHAWRVWRVADDERISASALALSAAIFAQIAIGIWTLLAVVPLPLALLHQAAAFILLAVAVWHAHALARR
jgi:cytochrome c oxidase assembly protein subunit 15